jgi:hypothetical protein
MNKDIKEELAVLDYAEKNGCTVAAARVRLGQSTARKPQLEGGTTELPVETLQDLADVEEAAE